MRATANDIALLEDKAAEAAEFLEAARQPTAAADPLPAGGRARDVGRTAWSRRWVSASRHCRSISPSCARIGVLATRRDAQTIYYRIADKNAARAARAAQRHLLPVNPTKDRNQT